MFYLLVIPAPTLQLQSQGPESPVGPKQHRDAESLLEPPYTNRGPVSRFS